MDKTKTLFRSWTELSLIVAFAGFAFVPATHYGVLKLNQWVMLGGGISMLVSTICGFLHYAAMRKADSAK